MKRGFFLLIFLGIITNQLKAQVVSINLSNINIKVHNNLNVVKDKIVMLDGNLLSDNYLLYRDAEVEVYVKFKLKTYEGVKRSSLKNSAYNLVANYVVKYKNQTRKIRTEHIFYQTDLKQFKENKSVYFRDRINNVHVNLVYTAIIN